MSIPIMGYSFEGPFDNTDSLKDKSGIYVILDSNSGKYYVLDCGESTQIKTRIEGHDRADCWKKHAKGYIRVAVLYTPNLSDEKRRQIEKAIRSKFNPPCGER
jgi:predicted GIY-YIG superfamily endonuclease